MKLTTPRYCGVSSIFHPHDKGIRKEENGKITGNMNVNVFIAKDIVMALAVLFL